jgi:predicted nuclease of restriction endonuclease-like (RecB) superfamily
MPKKPSLKIQGNVLIHPNGVDLTERVVSILEQARANVLRTVNSNMVIAYWLIGREIVQALQGGEVRAGYGDQLIAQLSTQLQATFGRGFSVTNLRYFRTFYTVYGDRVPEIRHIGCGELNKAENRHTQSGVLADLAQSVEQTDSELGFSPNLGWSHYRVLMAIELRNERLFYEIEAEKEGWDVKHLKRQVYTQLFARLLKSSDKAGVMALTREGHTVKTPVDTIKEPYILDFLGLPDSKILHESDIEAAIIDNLQAFLLELGKGFAFVSRQKRIQFGEDFFYIDLVFYHCILKCYVLIDLKIGELTHQDVGQIDSYVRMFDDKYLSDGDNPTIGLILCAKKNETIAKYSVLNDSKQIFASKYMLYLPSEEVLSRELAKERALIEAKLQVDQENQ